MIIDAHAHLGYDVVFDQEFPASDLIAGQEQNGIDVTLVQPGTAHDLEGARSYHDAIAALCREHPGRFHGIANPNPHVPGDGYERAGRRGVEEMGCGGVKVHPPAHAVNPGGRDGRRAFALADRLGVPVIVHTGSGIPWAAPALLDPIATEHPDVKIVLAHAGGMILAGEAGQLAERHANVFLECSWTGAFLVRGWIERFGANRILFGSDHADNAATELTKFRSTGCTAEELAWALGGTAAAVFRLPAR